jgi:large subunit ribosomal protein L25
MTKNAELKAWPRTGTGKEAARKLRAQGRLPGVIYGKDMEARGISLDLQETVYLFQHISVENTIVSLKLEGEEEPLQALIREIQTLPHKPGLLHVDFLRIQKGVAVEVDIPVSLDGIPVGVREGGGVLEQMINELRVKCIPSMIPEVVSVDVTGLGVGDSIHVGQIDLGEGVDLLVEADRTVCSVQVPRILAADEEEEEEVEAEEAEGEEEVSGGDEE